MRRNNLIYFPETRYISRYLSIIAIHTRSQLHTLLRAFVWNTIYKSTSVELNLMNEFTFESASTSTRPWFNVFLDVRDTDIALNKRMNISNQVQPVSTDLS